MKYINLLRRLSQMSDKELNMDVELVDSDQFDVPVKAVCFNDDLEADQYQDKSKNAIILKYEE